MKDFSGRCLVYFLITITTYFQTHFCHPLTQSLYFPPFVLVYELKITTFLLCFFVYSNFVSIPLQDRLRRINLKFVLLSFFPITSILAMISETKIYGDFLKL
jgi:glucose-6-phosphate-specific signal transduction histidine kinase